MRPTSTPPSSFLHLVLVPLVEYSNSGWDYALIYFLLLWDGCRAFFFPTLLTLITFSKGGGMKEIYLWQSFVIHFIFFRMCCILDQIHGCTPTDKIRNKRSQTMLASGQQPHFTAVEGRVVFFFAWHIHKWYNSDARNIENTKQNATRPKPLTEFICENFKRDSDEDYPDWGNSRVDSSLRDAMPSPSVHMQSPHWSYPNGYRCCDPPTPSLRPFPTTCNPTDEDVAAPSWVLGDKQPLIRFPDKERVYDHGQLVPLLLATAREHPL